MASSAVKDKGLTGVDIKNNRLTGDDVNESSLGVVPSAASAANADNAANAANATNAGSAQPVAFALVDWTNGPVSRNKNITNANVTKVNNGTYCITGLPFTIQGAQVTTGFGGTPSTGMFTAAATPKCPNGGQVLTYSNAGALNARLTSTSTCTASRDGVNRSRGAGFGPPLFTLRHNGEANFRGGAVTTTQTEASTNGASAGGNPPLESFNPATGDRLGAVPTLTPDQVQAVVDDVTEVQPFWAQLPLADRARYMRRTAQVLIDNLEDLTLLLSREQGKPRAESYSMELIPTIDALHWIADNGPDILSPEPVRGVPIFAKQKKHHFSYEPLGVVGVIAPWNYPWSIPFGEVAMALMAGNGVVLKPASLTPLIGERIRWAFERAGLPEGIVRTVHGGGKVGNALVGSSASKIFFTGSVDVGRGVGVACAERLKGCVLELGGKDSVLVLPDANLQNAVDGTIWGGFANAGQTCSGIERVYVMREIADRFIDGVVEGAKKLRVGDPTRPDVEVGPMVSEDQYDLVKELVDDAVASGAKLHCGGPAEPDGLHGKFYAPAVLTDVTPEMRIMREEIFGPVVPITVVDSEEEAISLANDSEFGLGNSVWTLDREKGERIAERLESGMVWINEHMYTHGLFGCAWGGVKDSGLGRSHSQHGLLECVNIKQVAWEPSLWRSFWWHPYDDSNTRGLHAAAQLLYGRDEDKAKALRKGIRPLARLGRKTLKGAFKR